MSQEDTKVCKTCGLKNSANAKECPRCGYQFETTTLVMPAIKDADKTQQLDITRGNLPVQPGGNGNLSLSLPTTPHLPPDQDTEIGGQPTLPPPPTDWRGLLSPTKWPRWVKITAGTIVILLILSLV